MYVAIFILLAVGFYILGYMFGRRHYTSRSVGQLRVDQSDEDGPYLFLEMEKPVEYLLHSDYAVLKINTKSYISQE